MNQTTLPTREVHPERYLGRNIDWTNVPNRNSTPMSELFPPPRPVAGGPLSSHPVIVPNSNSAPVSDPLAPPPVDEDTTSSGQSITLPQGNNSRARELLAPPQPAQERPWSGLVDAEAAMQYMAKTDQDAESTESSSEWQDASDEDDETAATEASLPKYFGEHDEFKVPRKPLPENARRHSVSATANLSLDRPPELARLGPPNPEIEALLSPRERLERARNVERMKAQVAASGFPDRLPINRTNTTPVAHAGRRPTARRLLSSVGATFHKLQDKLHR